MSDTLLSEYAYILDDSGVGRLYLITDVEELHEWHLAQCEKHPLFERIDDDVAEAEDSSVRAMVNETEEGNTNQPRNNAGRAVALDSQGSARGNYSAVPA